MNSKSANIKLLSSIFLSFSICVAEGQNPELILSKESGIYSAGEKISVFFQISQPVNDSVRLRILKNNDKIIERKAILPETDKVEVFTGSFQESCSIIVEARSESGFSSIGLLVAPGKIKSGAPMPRDFRSYWQKEKKKLCELPLEVRSKPVESSEIDKGFTCSDIEINCTGVKPARGYLVKPENPEPGSLPIVLLVHAAGVSGSWCRSEPKNAMVYARKGALCFDLNAHGMLNGQSLSYYTDLEKGELKGYWLQGITNRDDFYFRGMYLRLVRTIDYLTSQPEWDGKRILVIGESQGGGQALAAAGLDRRVSAVVAIVPAMCDWFGSVAGRRSGWPQPFESGAPKSEMEKTLPYFDTANLLKRSKATIFTEIGLIDMTCPATSVYAAINNSKGRKIVYSVPYRPHQQPNKSMIKTWEESVYKSRELFINDFLK